MTQTRTQIAEAYSNEAVAARLDSLGQAGAVRIDSAFRVAGVGQGEVIYQERRLFVTANTEGYRQYAAVLHEAGLPYVANDSGLGDEHVVVGEIPRDARTLPQIMFSKQPEGGFTSKDVFYMVGRALHRVALIGQAPKAEDLSLDRMLVLRDQSEILLPPPIEFGPLTDETEASLVGRMHEQLLPNYERFGGVALLTAFQQGMHDVDH